MADTRWARSAFARFRGCVAYIETVDGLGNTQNGTCFHVGDGVFVTAAHVVDGRTIKDIGFDDQSASLELLEKPENWGTKAHGSVEIVSGPHLHPDAQIDVACFKANPFPKAHIPLGGHLNGYLTQYELVLYPTLVLGYPRIPFADRPALVASVGEVNALIDKYTGGHPNFVVSTMARGGFSGGPALVAYNEANPDGGVAVLGVVTESLVRDKLEAELGYMSVLTVEPIYDCLKAYNLLPDCQKGSEHPT